MKPQEITFKADKKHRDKYFSAGSFAHPAKMILPLQRWLIEKYSKPGDVILDPMAGQGTLLIACTTGRHVIMVELESKFVQMQRDNWTKIQTLGPEMGYSMGTATILQGDARKLPDVLADVVISSPPYEAGMSGPSREPFWERLANDPTSKRFGRQKHPTIGQGYDQADVIMTSPPYAEADSRDERPHNQDGELMRMMSSSYTKTGQGKTDGQISALPYGNIDCVITSPPYEGITGNGKEIGSEGHATGPFSYGGDSQNIGNLKGESYLSAMLEVYQGCWRVLKPQGLLVLVTKNFIRQKVEIRLDLDTIKLCEQAGFELIERHYRKLTSQSFWRTIYRQKYPDAPILDKEDILIFRKLWSFNNG